MSNAKMTLIGLNDYDPTLFENLTFPAGINKDLAVDEILMRSGEFEILYPNPKFLKLAIEHWGKKNYRTFEKWIEALALEFNPLHNYDRHEEYSDTRELNENASSMSTTDTTTKDDSTLSRNVSAYDSTTYQPREQEINDTDVTVSGVGNAESANNSIEETTHDAHIYGNIGVTTSTQMLEDFLRVERFNIYEQIADMFLTDFCVLVY